MHLPAVLLTDTRTTPFSLSLHTTQNADPNSINARYQDGVLRVQVGKASEAESRKAIRIE